MSRHFLTALFLLLYYVSFSQDRSKSVDWVYIDTSITNNRNLQDIKLLVQKTKNDLLLQKKYLQAARCYYYEVKIADKRTEDSFYFRNSVFYDSLLMTKATPGELQIAIHLLLAKRLSTFARKGLKFNQLFYENEKLPNNYARYTNGQLDSLALEHYDQARKMLEGGKDYATADILWFSSDPLMFLFPPNFFDVIVSEQILLRSRGMNIYRTLDSRSADWSRLSPNEFIGKIDSAGAASNNRQTIFRLYSDWFNYHRKEKEKYYFIETLARKYYEGTFDYSEEDLKPGYVNYLANISQSQYSTVRAHGIYQLCLYWNKQGKKYFPVTDYELRSRSSYPRYKTFDTTYRYYLVKALQLYDQNRNMMDSFYYLGRILKKMESQIRKSELNIVLNSRNLPREPMMAEMIFKNIDTLQYQIVKVPHDFYTKIDDDLQKVIQSIREHQLVKEETVVLPKMTDYNRHSTYLKLESLPVGQYYLLFSNHPFSKENKEIEFVKFQVTSLAIVENIKELFVLDAKTGLPIEGANILGKHIAGKKDSEGKEIRIEKKFKTNAKGFTTITDSRLTSFDISYRGDTLHRSSNFEPAEVELENVYNKEEYDGLLDFYDENSEAYVYTDRSIYRPGQSVYYKVLFLTRHPSTGETILLSPKNLGNSLFKGLFKKWMKESQPYISITDPFNNERDSIPIKLSEFGTFSGTYVIPKTAATGEWSIEPDYIDVRNNAIFRVEEYKRPTYEMKIDGPKKQLLPGDSIPFNVKVKSFAGAQLNNVRIHYLLIRSGLMPGITASYITDTILNENGYTKESGELNIVAIDDMLKKMQFDESRAWSYRYELQVEAIDQTGESYTEDISVNVSTRPISIRKEESGPINLSKNNGILLRTRDIIEGNVSKVLKVEIYKITGSNQAPSKRELVEVDAWLYKKEELENWFPTQRFDKKDKDVSRQLIQSTSINTGEGGRIKLDSSLYSAGEYVLMAVCIENGKVIGKNEFSLSIFDEQKKQFPNRTLSFKYIPFNSLNAGDTVKLYNGNSEGPVYSLWQVRYYSAGKKTKIVDKFQFSEQSAGLHCWKWKVPNDAFERATIFQVYVFNNEYYQEETEVYIAGKTEAEPEIIIEKYRKKLAPGEKETFTVSIKTNNENVAAELMTTLYDASLDKLEKHTWKLPDPDRYDSPEDNWSWGYNGLIGKQFNWIGYREFRDETETSLQMPLWWVDPFYISEGDVMADWSSFRGRRNYSRGLSINFLGNAEISEGTNLLLGSAAGLSEVVVTGLGVERKLQGMSSGVVRIRGIASFSSFTDSKFLVILDGVPYEEELNKIDASTIVAGLILKGADATSLYGSRAANGVLILSTKGEIVLPEILEPPPPARKNFNELAFFFPAIHADKNGYYSLTFTMPESVTEWNWKLLAHTKLAKFIYAERKLNTQLPLMVQPNIPRLLYQGDKVVIQNRISNLDTLVSNGTITCKVEDVVTGEDVSSKFLGTVQKNYTIEQRSTKSVAFEITVPKEQLNPIKLIVNVRSAGFADGEEHVLPVLNPRVFVRQVQPFYLMQKDSTILPPTMPADVIPFGVGLSIRPKPQSALIHSLPYLAEYSFDCAEQVTNKIMALLTATQIMRTDSSARESYTRAKQKIEKSSPDSLPDQLSEETMPWLNYTNITSKQHERLFRLFDSSKTIERVEGFLDKLYKMQNADGGLTWFPGGHSNLYISQYVLGSFGQLKNFGMLEPNKTFAVDFNKFIEKLVGYCEVQLLEIDLKKGYDLVNIITSRSRWQMDYPISGFVQKRIDSILLKEWEVAERKHLSRQAPLILASLLNSQDNFAKQAIDMLNSISQLAIDDDQYGVRWKDIADADFMDGKAEETLATLAESYQLSGTHTAVPRGIIKWLTLTRTDEHWGSTKATAAVVNLLRSESKNIISPTIDVNVTGINNGKIGVSNDLLSGSLFDVRQVNSFPSQIKIEKTQSIPVAGNMIWYYFGTSLVSNNGVIVRKQVHKLNRDNNQWELVDENSILKIADQLRISLEIESSRPLQYVYIDDKRAAGLEPLVNNSGYEYGPFGHYRSVRDAGIQFFADYIPSGRHTISYEVKVAHEGSFMNGPASLQCMYRPDLNAVSNSIRVRVVETR